MAWSMTNFALFCCPCCLCCPCCCPCCCPQKNFHSTHLQRYSKLERNIHFIIFWIPAWIFWSLSLFKMLNLTWSVSSQQTTEFILTKLVIGTTRKKEISAFYCFGFAAASVFASSAALLSSAALASSAAFASSAALASSAAFASSAALASSEALAAAAWASSLAVSAADLAVFACKSSC